MRQMRVKRFSIDQYDGARCSRTGLRSGGVRNLFVCFGMINIDNPRHDLRSARLSSRQGVHSVAAGSLC